MFYCLCVGGGAGGILRYYNYTVLIDTVNNNSTAFTVSERSENYLYLHIQHIYLAFFARKTCVKIVAQHGFPRG